MQREIDIFQNLPSIMQKIKQFQGIREGENPEFRALFQAVEQVLNRAFIEESDEAGIRRWERMLNIAASGDLDVRKFRVLARMNERLPYTMPIVKQQLQVLCGPDGYTLALNHEEYTLRVELAFLVSEKLAAVREYLERIKPANILVRYGLWNPAIALMESHKFIVQDLTMPVFFWNRPANDTVILNGARKLDGTWFLDQPTRGISRQNICMNITVKNHNTVTVNEEV